jgi:PAS domain S-box-containing protein
MSTTEAPGSSDDAGPAATWLGGGGAMAAAVAAHDWRATPLGPIEAWPQSLKTAVGIMLTSRYQMWMLWGPELTFFCNDAYRPTLGVKGDWALGARSDRVWSEIWVEIGPRIETVLTTGTATWDEGLRLFLERSGYLEETYHTFSYSPLRDDAGAIAGMLCVVSEETERLIGERRLATLGALASELASAQSDEQLAAAIARGLGGNGSDLPFTLVYLFDEPGLSARRLAATGIAADHPAAPAVLRLDDAASPWPAAELMLTGAAVRVPDLSGLGPLPTGQWDDPARQALLCPIAQPGQEGPAGFLVTALNPFRSFDAAYAGFIELIAGQIAAGLANAHAYDAERRRADALAELDRAKTAFFSNVSHEFRTPLTLMLSPLEELLAHAAQSLPADDRSLVETAHRNGLRLLKLVNTLLDFARIEAGRVEASFSPVDLAALTADLASSFRSAMERAGLAFVVDAAPLPQPVHVDREMWEKIVLNLLSNAFKFTFAGSVTVTLAPSADRSAAVLTVRDTGTGIPAQELPRLFERFHRVTGARGRTFEGSGIGLALVQELVKLNGGTIGVDSELGAGTAFTVMLPFGTAHLPADRIRDRQGDTLAGLRADAYVAEALRWLPGAGEDAVDSLLDPPERSLGAAPLGAGDRVLLADDNADMRGYVGRLLAAQGYAVEAVGDGEAALAAARRELPDLVLSDVMMPRLDGFGLLRALRADPALRDRPVILLSARAGEEARVEGVDAGADDYLTKPFSARELLARVGANLAMARIRREAIRSLRELNETLEERVAARTRERDSIWRLSRELMLVTQPDSTSLALNPAWAATLGWDEAELVGARLLELVHPEDRATTVAALTRLGAEPAGVSFANRLRHRDGSYRDIDWTAVPGEGVIYGVGRDVTEARAIEERLRQAQRMETIGQLTGGVAHDFNNLLTVVIGNLENVQRNVDGLLVDAAGSRIRRAADNAMRGAQRAASLTQRLLAFARRQPLDPKALNVNRLVAGMSELIDRTLGDHIEVETVLGAGLWWTLADPNELENALLNLAVNARDAMPDGGKLTIETSNAYLDDRYVLGQAEIVPGQYVNISVSDTGAGMAPDTIAQAFEPFFTTKDAGHGTGLGLSQVYGFVKQSGGHVKLYSEFGQGTTVKIYLPRHRQGEDEPDAQQLADAPPLGDAAELVLLVEDDDDVRAYSAELVRELGYHVLEAGTGAMALQLLERHPGVRLLFTDVGLPGGMNGRQLADAAVRLRPGLPVLFTTGYARNAIVHGGRLDPGVQLITKPFDRQALAGRLREVLDAAAPTGRVLLVEDEALVRMVAAEILADAGLAVVEAGTVAEAVRAVDETQGGWAAAVLDFTLPDGSAADLARRLREASPGLPLLIASGHVEAELRQHFAGLAGVVFIGKPYESRALTEALRRLGVRLSGPAPSP